MVESVGSFPLCVELFKTGSEVVLLDDLTVSLTSIDVSATGMHIAILFYRGKLLLELSSIDYVRCIGQCNICSMCLCYLFFE